MFPFGNLASLKRRLTTPVWLDPPIVPINRVPAGQAEVLLNLVDLSDQEMLLVGPWSLGTREML